MCWGCPSSFLVMNTSINSNFYYDIYIVNAIFGCWLIDVDRNNFNPKYCRSILRFGIDLPESFLQTPPCTSSRYWKQRWTHSCMFFQNRRWVEPRCIITRYSSLGFTIWSLIIYFVSINGIFVNSDSTTKLTIRSSSSKQIFIIMSMKYLKSVTKVFVFIIG